MTGMRQRRRIPASVRLERDKRNRLAGSISVAGDVSGPGFSRYHVEKQNRSPCRRSVTTPPSTIVSTVDHEKTGNLEIREGVNQEIGRASGREECVSTGRSRGWPSN